jgi:DNA-binding NarL/FixJ family response regulator
LLGKGSRGPRLRLTSEPDGQETGLRLIALGHTYGEIAAQRYLSVRTVESHRAHIQQKTQRTSRAELVAYAREHELL